MRAIDKAGNITEANNEIKTVIVESLPKAKRTCNSRASTEEPTNKPVTVTFKRDGTAENMHTEYQVGGTDENKWLKGDTCIVEKNEIIYVRLVDEAEQKEEDWKEVKVGNIDKKEPNEFEIKSKSNIKQYNGMDRRNCNRSNCRRSKRRNNRNKRISI